MAGRPAESSMARLGESFTGPASGDRAADSTVAARGTKRSGRPVTSTILMPEDSTACTCPGPFEFVRVRQGSSRKIRIRQNSSVFVSVRQGRFEFVRVRQGSSGFVREDSTACLCVAAHSGKPSGRPSVAEAGSSVAIKGNQGAPWPPIARRTYRSASHPTNAARRGAARTAERRQRLPPSSADRRKCRPSRRAPARGHPNSSGFVRVRQG